MNKFKIFKTYIMKYLYPFVLTILFFINSSVWSQSWVINNNSKIKMQAGTFVVIDGNVQNDNNGEFDNLGTIQLTGNWTNNAGNTAFVNSSPGTVVLNGANQLINGTDSTVFYNLNLEGSGSKQIDVNTSVEGVLSLNDKEFLTNNFSLFILNSALGSITRTTGFISSIGNGCLSRLALNNQAYLFPVGSSLGTSRYRPVEVTPTTSASNTYTVRMANADATTEGFDRSITDGTAGNINDKFYHKINRSAGSDAASISIYFDDVDDGTFFGIAHWDDTPSDQWENTGTVNPVNNSSPVLSSLTIVNWDDFTSTPFALFSCVPSVAADSISFNPDPVCEGESVTLTVHGGSLGTGASWEWYTDGCGSTHVGTGNPLSLNVSGTTTFYVRAEGTCGITECKSVLVKPTVISPVSITVAPDNNPVCYGTNVTFTATPINEGSNPQYQWYLNGATVGTSNSTYTNSALTNADEIYCVLTSDAICTTGNPASSDTVTMTISSNLPVSVTVAADATTICDGTNVTFTATPGNEGVNPQYQWYLNGATVGTSSNTYTNNLLSDADEIYCVLTSDATCITGNPASSDTVTMTVNSNLPVSVTISADATTICDGTNVTFTATPINEGPNPQYQWYLNGATVGTSNSTYTNAALTNADEIYCVLTSDATCITGNPATSDTVTMTVSSNLPVSVTIAADATTICDGTYVTFTATPSNEGVNPQYQWYLNGATVGTNSNEYTNNLLSDADEIYCVLTSDATCATGNPATSNTVTMTVSSNLPVSVTVAADATSICDGTNVTFTATPVNGGSNPQYQWYLNGATVGTSNNEYTNNLLSDADEIYCVLTSDAICITGNPASSDTVTMTVSQDIPILLVTDPASSCSTAVDITDAAITNGSSYILTLSYWTDAGATISLTNPNSITTSGIYYIVASNTCGSDTASVNVYYNISAPVLVINNPASVCNTLVDITAAAVTAGSSGIVSISYWTDAGAFSPLANPDSISLSGIYYIQAINACGTDIEAVNVTINTGLPLLVINNPAPVCAPLFVDLTAPAVTSGSTQIETISYWANSALTIPLNTPDFVTISGLYYIQATNTCGTTSQEVPVNVFPSVPELVINPPAAACFPAQVDLTADTITSGSSGIYALSYWMDAGATIPLVNPQAISQSGTYYIQAINTCGTDIGSVTVNISTVPPTLTIHNPGVVCSGGSVNLTSSAITLGSSQVLELSYWMDNSALIPLTNPANVTTAGTYYIMAWNGCGSNIQPVQVMASTALQIAATINHESCEDRSDGRLVLTIIGGTVPYFYAWSNGETTATISSLASGVYTVTVTDGSNCFEMETYTINASTILCNELFIPTIFTPDANGVNDVLYVRGKRIVELDMMIFDRIGNKVFETKDKNFGWDGNYKDKPLNSAVFVYYVKAIFENGEVIEKKGDVTLIR
ncbi:MAG TPA: hypothetical protein DEH02_07000 [Bacteroidales bacterium]|nr:hypothetical protein [Bacteroidales bacterium]